MLERRKVACNHLLSHDDQCHFDLMLPEVDVHRFASAYNPQAVVVPGVSGSRPATSTIRALAVSQPVLA